MHLHKNFTTVLALFISLLIYGQQSDKFTNPLYEFKKGLELYNAGTYEGAFNYFQRVQKNVNLDPNITEACAYYLAITGIKLEKTQSDKMLLDFADHYPTSQYKNKAYLEAGNFYYTHGTPARSLKWFEKVSTKYLTPKEEANYNFKIAYAYFTNKKYTEAKQYFLPLTISKDYDTKAQYYYGYISYLQGDYSTALTYFDKLEGNKHYKKEILYYKMNIKFQHKKFEKVVGVGKDLLKIVPKRDISEISKVIGESYFYLEDYKNAATYLEKYEGRNNILINEDYYFLGYSYYKLKDYEKAILKFNQILKGNTEVAQNAYYHLGACYLKQDKKSEALNAFKNSSELNFNEEIREDAAYNYAKLSYEIGNPYQSSAEVLQEYVTQYSNSSNAKDINKLIIDTYNSSRDFEGALSYYRKRELSKDKTFYQITMHRGMQLFQYAKYNESLNYFKIASSQVIANDIQAQALFWRAEASYRLNDFKIALSYYRRFQNLNTSKKTKEYQDLNYSIGYTYFKLKDYRRAKSRFASYIASKPNAPVKLNDSYVRLGDCNFITKSYWEGIEAYNKIISTKGIDDDYAQYQKAISYGFVGKNENKIKTLKDFSNQHPKSSYKDDALFELGNAYLSAKDNLFAIQTYDELIKSHKTSLYIPKAMLKQGLIFFNDNDPNKALEKYKYVVAQYPSSKESQEAVQNARQVYIDIDKVDAYAKWIREINYTNFSDTDLDNAMYEAAEKKYVNHQFVDATHSFKKYLINFPKGIHALKANFYSAQAYFSLENTEKALPKYIYVAAQSSNEYTEQSLARLAQIYLEKNAWSEAILYLKRLEVEANFPQNILFAQSNLMKILYNQEQYSETVVYSEKVLANKKADLQVKSDASIYIARSAIMTNDMVKAEKAYSEISKEAKGSLKAEALYYESFFKNKAGKYGESNDIIQNLASKYANHKYWGVKGLILMAENNIGLNDVFQATYILESIIKNYGQFEELTHEASRILEQLKTVQKFKEGNSDATVKEEKEIEKKIEF
jgi:tetratricopeptide (TPR) repeat protein